MVRGNALTSQPQASSEAVLQRSRPELVLLHGSLRGDSLSHRVKRSVLDLPLRMSPSLMHSWMSEANALRQHLKAPRLSVTLMLDEGMPAPALPRDYPELDVQIRRDPAAVRGTGGVLRDVLASRPAHHQALVTHAAQTLRLSLVEIHQQLRGALADVAVLTQADRAPAGFYLIRCGCLAQLPAQGYVDFKEQALPRIGVHGTVRAVVRDEPVTDPLRSLSDYLAAVHGGGADRRAGLNPANLTALIEAGARVHRDARLYNSVVLREGVVEADAVVIESVVTAGQRIAAGQILSRGVLHRLQRGERVGGRTVSEPMMARLRALLGRSRETFARPAPAVMAVATVLAPMREPALADGDDDAPR